ncbi:hypothetical protein HETIRDRAFT_119323 [Heterobasidion irregulare TC 32-1]|uniref:Uncharacterized protein n=1 Tax=Heterobasidion irregulare (strain TC 32-1) TaxID=747525 RepID=W4KD54_HETIT|nr:uncharacterized protein HETIRDRAFT_119323 [Heterobasidion irregulare TC 32-1]XP_009552343.1 uncharacterized protein HETIRDRAFT_455688 [Heterobasidion irregulare TC 32-1]ETW76125.1 hypothetical protein HETIRDRAFT_455688 [Heterobasidion irregulare TC 32-1]ETW83255.1 hypothetical protein HETIRDRAFT_119323 [Heterobasidion irregulare TC 32-1]
MSTNHSDQLSWWNTLPRSLFRKRSTIFPQPPVDFQPLIVPSHPRPDLIDVASVFPPPRSFSSILSEPIHRVDLALLAPSITVPETPVNVPGTIAITPVEPGIRMPPMQAGGIMMGVTVITERDGVWLEEGVSIDVIEKKENGVFDYQSIVLGQRIWRDDRIVVFSGKASGKQIVVIASTHRVNSPSPMGYALYHNFGEYIRALFIADREREVTSTEDVEEITRRALGGAGAQIFRRFRHA